MSFSVARSARSILRVCRQSANDLPPSDHSLSVHSTSSPTLHLYRLHRHSSSVPAILVACYLARSRSSRPATAQVPLLIVSPASLCCFVFASACLLAYVSECNTTPSPWWLLCLQWSVRATRTAERLSELISQSQSMSVHHSMSVNISRPSAAIAERSGRNETNDTIN